MAKLSGRPILAGTWMYLKPDPLWKRILRRVPVVRRWRRLHRVAVPLFKRDGQGTIIGVALGDNLIQIGGMEGNYFHNYNRDPVAYSGSNKGCFEPYFNPPPDAPGADAQHLDAGQLEGE